MPLFDPPPKYCLALLAFLGPCKSERFANGVNGKFLPVSIQILESCEGTGFHTIDV
jgi:hypothetical protein